MNTASAITLAFIQSHINTQRLADAMSTCEGIQGNIHIMEVEKDTPCGWSLLSYGTTKINDQNKRNKILLFHTPDSLHIRDYAHATRPNLPLALPIHQIPSQSGRPRLPSCVSPGTRTCMSPADCEISARCEHVIRSDLVDLKICKQRTEEAAAGSQGG